MAEQKLYPVPTSISRDSHISKEDYKAKYKQSVEEPERFWAEQAERFISWDKKWDSVSSNDFLTAKIQWFDGGYLNACYNCLDRHLENRAEQSAIIWE